MNSLRHSAAVLPIVLAGTLKDVLPLTLITGLHWIPLLCVITYMAAFSIGLHPIAWLLMGEIFPLEYRGIGTSMTSVFCYIFAFASVKSFVDLKEAVGMDGTFWTYAVISFLGLLFSLLMVPETKGQTLDEMQPRFYETSSQDSGSDRESTNTSTSDVHSV